MRRTCITAAALTLTMSWPAVAYAVDLAEALRRALRADPRIAAANVEVEATQGAIIQAGKRPNPELQVELEDFFGTGDYRGFDKAVLTISLQQKFERGDKVGARLAVARGKEAVANAEIAVVMREIITQTKIDYIQVLGAQQRIELLGRASKRFDELLPLLKRRVEAGASSPADVSRGDLALGKAKAAIDKARTELTGARRILAANWSGTLAEGNVAGRLRHNGHQPVALASLLQSIDEHPAIVAWNAVYGQREGELRLQRATSVPDLTASVGVKRIFDTDDTAFRIGGSIPLPVHDRNEGGIIEGERKLAKVEHEREAARRVIKRRIIEAFAEFDTSCVEGRRLSEVLPAARRATESVQSGFDQGRLSVKELLDAVRDQYDLETQQLEADIRCHSAAAKVETLASNRKPFQHGWEAVTRRR